MDILNSAPLQTNTIIHLLWDGDFGGIQKIVKTVFLDNAGSRYRHIAVLAGHFGPLIGPASDRFCLGMKNGFDVPGFFKLRSIAKRFPGAIIVYHLDTPIFRLFYPKDRPLIYLEHGCSAKRDQFRYVNKLLGKALLQRARKIICISRQSQADITSLYPQFAAKTMVVNNPVLIPFGKPRIVPRAPATIGFIGRLSREKGPEGFLQCARILFKKYPGIRFTMVGDGPLLRECREMAQQAGLPVAFTGVSLNITHNLELMDIIAITSLKDAFNMVVIEAMARGVPVAAFPVGGIPEIITHNVMGLLSEAASPHLLAHCIERILNETGLYEKLSSNGFLHAKRTYGLDEYRKQWENIFKDAFAN
jgi:glycosyltransferase involved in cell wall biosynthesis